MPSRSKPLQLDGHCTSVHVSPSSSTSLQIGLGRDHLSVTGWIDWKSSNKPCDLSNKAVNPAIIGKKKKKRYCVAWVVNQHMDWKQEAKSCRAGYKFCKWKWITCVWVSVCKAVNKEKDVLWMTRRLLRVISSSVPLLMNHFNKWLEMCFVRASVRPCLCVSKNNATTKWTNYRSSCTPRRVLELQTVVICLCFCEAFLWNVAFSNSPPALTGFCWFIYLFIF